VSLCLRGFLPAADEMHDLDRIAIGYSSGREFRFGHDQQILFYGHQSRIRLQNTQQIEYGCALGKIELRAIDGDAKRFFLGYQLSFSFL